MALGLSVLVGSITAITVSVESRRAARQQVRRVPRPRARGRPDAQQRHRGGWAEHTDGHGEHAAVISVADQEVSFGR